MLSGGVKKPDTCERVREDEGHNPLVFESILVQQNEPLAQLPSVSRVCSCRALGPVCSMRPLPPAPVPSCPAPCAPRRHRAAPRRHFSEDTAGGPGGPDPAALPPHRAPAASRGCCRTAAGRALGGGPDPVRPGGDRCPRAGPPVPVRAAPRRAPGSRSACPGSRSSVPAGGGHPGAGGTGRRPHLQPHTRFKAPTHSPGVKWCRYQTQ